MTNAGNAHPDPKSGASANSATFAISDSVLTLKYPIVVAPAIYGWGAAVRF